MKLFIDTANIEEIEDAISKGIISGVTTNPSLLAKEPKADFYDHIQKIANVCTQHLDPGVPLSVEVFAVDPDEMIKQAHKIMETINYSNLNIKIPIGYEELRVVNQLSKSNIPVNCTCCFTSTQLQLAAAAGARYVSLFYNRLLDVDGDPSLVLAQTRRFIDQNNLDCEIISGSIRNPEDVSAAWAAGCHIVTAGHKIIIEMTEHSQTDMSISGFLEDFKGWISK
jgi:transaldolase